MAKTEMKKSNCIVNCVGPDCEGCREYKTAKSMKANDKKPTKEEILKSKFKNSFLDLDYLELYIEAMQEYAEQFHKEKLRGELIKFNAWGYGCINTTNKVITDDVDEYLKTN